MISFLLWLGISAYTPPRERRRRGQNRGLDPEFIALAEIANVETYSYASKFVLKHKS